MIKDNFSIHYYLFTFLSVSNYMAKFVRKQIKCKNLNKNYTGWNWEFNLSIN